MHTSGFNISYIALITHIDLSYPLIFDLYVAALPIEWLLYYFSYITVFTAVRISCDC